MNSFQVVLITNGMTTFAMLNYQNSGLERIMSYRVRFHGGRSFYAQVGFSAGDQVRYAIIINWRHSFSKERCLNFCEHTLQSNLVLN